MKAVRIGVTVATTVAVVAAAAPAASASPVSARSRSATCTILSGTADSSCTPGATNPDVTQDTIDSTICVPGWTAKVRPPASYTTALKNRQKAGYGEADLPNSALEEDHVRPVP